MLASCGTRKKATWQAGKAGTPQPLKGMSCEERESESEIVSIVR